MLDALFVLAGFVGLVVGGDLLVRGAVALARRISVSPMVIGLTLVGFGTSTPELLTSISAALAGSAGIAVGNVVGSNIANVLLIIGAAAAIAPIAVAPSTLRRDGTVLAAASVVCLAVVWSGALNRPAGGVLVAMLIVYIAATIMIERRAATAAIGIYEAEAEMAPSAHISAWRAFGEVAAGLVLMLIGARLLVSGAIALAADLGMPEAVIGLTVVAIGTSLPELVTSVIAARRGESGVALGNVIGSNLFNILGILGVTALVRPIAVPPAIMQFDIWVMLGATALLLVFARTGWRIGRREAAILLAMYALYTGSLLLGA